MTFRTVLAIGLVVAACGKGTPSPAGGDTGANKSGTARDSASGNVSGSGDTMRGSLAENHSGRIPVLEYHVIGSDKNGLYSRTLASFKDDLEDVYKRGYRPITIAQMLDKDFSDGPAGMSPVVFVSDDASPSQFRYLEQNGNLTIDPTSGVCVWV